MKPAAFDYFRPVTLAEAFDLLGRYGDEARLIAGGQSLVPMMNLRMAKPAVLVDLANIPGLSEISIGDDGLHIGAMTRQYQLLTSEVVKHHVPLLPKAVAHIGHFQTRCRGTIGGSLAHADPSAELSLVMVTLGATIRLQNAQGERLISAREFFRDALTTAIADGEVLTEAIVPLAGRNARVSFHEYARRYGDFAMASAAVSFDPDKELLLAGLGAVGTVPHFCSGLGEAMMDGRLELESAPSFIAQELLQIEPISDLNASGEYRRRLASVLLLDCLEEVLAP